MSVLELIEAQVRARPREIAVVTDHDRVTYAELDRAAEGIAVRLLAAGAQPDVPVAVCARRDANLVAALLGVWKSGAPYLPVDPALPAARLDHMLADSGARIVLADADVAARLPRSGTSTVLNLAEPRAGGPERRPISADPAALAYLMYTSGSTGVPKGVMVTHGALRNLTCSIRDDVALGAGGVWLAATSISFDISALELYLPLATGGRIVLASDADAKNPVALAELIRAHGVTSVQATPSGWRLLLATGLTAPRINALAGGEALPTPLAVELRGRVGRLVNVYGPTETTVWSSWWEVPPEPEVMSLGGPLAGTTLSIVDTNGRPAPPGIGGELHIGGAGLARGYRNRPGLTASRFVPDPDGPPGARRYRTGDLVRRTGGGDLEFLGRADTQVKLRGYRIELGEIQARLAEHPDVREAVVVVREPAPGDQRLTACLVPAPGRRLDVAGLRAHLATTLPDYMIPTAFVALPRMPLNTSGKVDYQALRRPRQGARS